MTSFAWTELYTFIATDWSRTAQWTAALEDLGDAKALRFTAEGEWTPLGGLPACGPDGIPGMSWSDLVVDDCPLGALVGRLGGSTALIKGGDPEAKGGITKPFAIGSLAVVRIPSTVSGPLFIGINVLQRPVTISQLRLTISASVV